MNELNEALESGIEDDIADIEQLIADMARMRRELEQPQRTRVSQSPIYFNARNRDNRDDMDDRDRHEQRIRR